MRGNSGFLRLAVICCLLVCSVSGGVPRPRRMMRETFANPVEELSLVDLNETLNSDKCSYNGKEVERSSVTCEQKNGCREIETHGECCPKFACECKLNGTTYDNGDKIVDPENPCEVCVCRGGDINCNALKCYTRNDCKNVTYTPGVCCPEYSNCPPLENVELSTNETTTTASYDDFTPSSVIPSETPTTVLTTTLQTSTQPSTQTNDNPVGIKIKEITKPEEIRITDDRPKVFKTIKSSEVIAPQTSLELQNPERIIEPEHEAPLIITEIQSEIEPEIEQHTTFTFDGSADQPIQLESADLNTDGDVSMGPKTVRQTDFDMEDEIHTTDAPFSLENEIKNEILTTKLEHVTEGPLENLSVERNTSVLQVGDSVVIFDRSGQTQSIPLRVAGLQRGDEEEEDERGRKPDEAMNESSTAEPIFEHSTSNEVFEVYYYEPKDMSTESIDFPMNEASGDEFIHNVKLQDDLKEGSADLQNVVSSTEKDDFDHSSGYSSLDRFTDPMLAQQSTVNEKTVSYDFEGSTSTSEEMSSAFESFVVSTSTGYLFSSEPTTTEDEDIVQHDQNINFPHITDDLSIHGSRMEDRMEDEDKLRANSRVIEAEWENIKIDPMEQNSIIAEDLVGKEYDSSSTTAPLEEFKGSTNFNDVEGRSPGEPLLIPEWERNHTTVAPFDLTSSSNETSDDLLAELSSHDNHTSDSVADDESTTKEPDFSSSTVASDTNNSASESDADVESKETHLGSSQVRETNDFKMFLEGTADFFKIQGKLWN